MPCSHSHSHSHSPGHSHSHSPGHSHSHPPSVSAANTAHFDSQAHTYGVNPSHLALAGHITTSLLSTLPLTPTTSLLDYACGPGLLSKSLAAHVGRIRGIDLSPAMVAAYNEAVSNQGIPRDEMCAFVGDICDDEAAAGLELEMGEGFEGFDVVVCSLALHHVEDAGKAAERLVKAAKVGGVVAVVEFARHGGEGMEGMDSVVTKHGFSREEMRGLIEGAGCGEVEFVEVGPKGNGKGVTLVREEGGKERRIEREVFLVTGKRL